MRALRPKSIKVLTSRGIRKALGAVPLWAVKKGKIFRDFAFNNYRETSAFVKEAVRVAQKHNHHPRIDFTYKNCKITYETHHPKGLTARDFDCARLLDRNYKKYQLQISES